MESNLKISTIVETWKSIGTNIQLKLILDSPEDEDRAWLSINAAKEIYVQQEKIFSRFDRESELAKINSNLGKAQSVSAQMKYIIERALYYYDLSGGLYDPRIIETLENIGYRSDFYSTDFSQLEIEKIAGKEKSSLKDDLEIVQDKAIFRKRMDFSGIVKGYISDQVAAYLGERGFSNFLVDSGGDIRVRGVDKELGSDGWIISLEGFPENKLRLKLADEGIATSGIARRHWENKGQRYHHLIDPRNPSRFEFSLKSVTVIAPTTEEADFWAKVLFIEGRESAQRLAQEKNIASLFLDSRGNVTISSKIQEKLLV